jgi:hypothetical protein
MKPLRIANAQGFWGDSMDAASKLAAGAPDLDYITLDYLAEVSMSILAKQRQRDPSAGYARDFLEVVRSLLPFWREEKALRIVTNAGGLNPVECARQCQNILRKAAITKLKVAAVSGDDVLPILLEDMRGDPREILFPNLETGASIRSIQDRLVTANAYLGAAPLVEALQRGADLVITGRVADPSLTVAPCVAHFGWNLDDYTRLAGATVAGHLIECGTQVTGGNWTNWLELPDPVNIGFPIAEVSADGSCVISKPIGTGGSVNAQTVKEQLLYEIGDPARYLSPDATVSFLTLEVNDSRNDRVSVRGATGEPPPNTYKVSATYRAGYRASGMLTIIGHDAAEKARRCGGIILERLRQSGMEPRRTNVECLGAGGAEVVLRVTVSDERREIVERFTRELAPLITSGPPGVTGYAEGRPVVHEVFGYWPTLIERSRVRAIVEML